MGPPLLPLVLIGLVTACCITAAVASAIRLRRTRRRAGMLERRLTWYSHALSFAGIGTWDWDAATNRWAWSDEVYRIRGFEAGKDIPAGEMFYARVHPDDRARLLAEENACMANLAPLSVEYRFILPDGQMRWMRELGNVTLDDQGRVTGMQGVVMDITDERQAKDRIAHRSHHDDLTGLPNRAYLMSVLDDAVTEAAGTGNHFALAFVDLNGFKPVNDRHGHRFGDLVLQRLAKRLTRAMRPEDFVGRLGGDEFVVIMPRTPGSAQDMAAIVRHVAEQVFTPMTIEGVEVAVGASIGLSLYPETATTPAGLIAAADQAMYRAKASGGMVALQLAEAAGPVSDT
jgi:diguanylate cyclase (GGDEF)-like protein/PAS domain S-box-containing protein